ncbi:hypothetical protein D3C78_1668430 [compost metagenome]
MKITRLGRLSSEILHGRHLATASDFTRNRPGIGPDIGDDVIFEAREVEVAAACFLKNGSERAFRGGRVLTARCLRGE